MGDRTDPVNALKKAQAHISKEEQRFRASLPGVTLNQAEYDVYMDFVYQYGRTAGERQKPPSSKYVQGGGNSAEYNVDFAGELMDARS